MKPLPKEQVQQTAQILLAYLDSPENSTPNNMVEGIVSGKSLMRGLITGTLVVCQTNVPAAAPPADPPAGETAAAPPAATGPGKKKKKAKAKPEKAA